MKKEEKVIIIDKIKDLIENSKHFYITDISELNAKDTFELRKECFGKNIKLVTVKNKLLKLALEKLDGNYNELYDTLKGSSSLMLSDTGNAPAKLIRKFRKTKKKPIIKAAYVEEAFYFGDQELKTLEAIKSKEELIGDIISILRSPINNVMSSLESGKRILSGVLKTMSEK